MINIINYFSSLPLELSSKIFDHVLAGDHKERFSIRDFQQLTTRIRISIREVCREWDAITQVSLQIIWSFLKNNSPLGAIRLNNRMKAIEAQPLHYSALFQKYVEGLKETYAINVPSPFWLTGYNQVQADAAEVDQSLISIWPIIQDEIGDLPTPPPASAEKIRAWLNNPANQAALDQISELNLQGLHLKFLPPEIGNFTSLKKLDLSHNDLQEVPKTIGNLKLLEVLVLNCNSLKEIPKAIGNLTRLKTLDLSHNDLQEVPKTIGNLKLLETLVLQFNNLKEIPKTIGNLTRLKKLDFAGNELEEIPEAIGNLIRLKELDLSTNYLGSLPKAIGKLTRLEELDLKGNNLKQLPGSIGNLQSLVKLRLEENELVWIPKAIGNLQSLVELNLSDNILLDSLPDTLDKLSLLEQFDIDRNVLTFIPDKILTSTKYVLSNNETIRMFKDELNYPSSSPLAKLHQEIIRRTGPEKIKKAFQLLSFKDKDLIAKTFLMFSETLGVNNEINTSNNRRALLKFGGEFQWKEHHLFSDMGIFYRSVQMMIMEKYSCLEEDVANRVDKNVCRLTKRDLGSTWNFPCLADAMALCDVKVTALFDAHLKDFLLRRHYSVVYGVDLKQNRAGVFA
jgi:Leucine-rich repeat (LRR) protein